MQQLQSGGMDTFDAITRQCQWFFVVQVWLQCGVQSCDAFDAEVGLQG